MSPGLYCGGLTVKGSAQVTLSPGTYVISGGRLEVFGTSSFTGSHVSFYLNDAAATIAFRDTATIDLSGAATGEMAGLLFFEDHAAPPDRRHHISSTNVRNLERFSFRRNHILRL